MKALFPFTRKHKAKKARAARREAIGLYLAAKDRGDTRGQHEAAKALQAATTRALALEVGR